ncbi:HNH endonuclease [Streptomyces hirsutus]|uniref:HNH endonuclease n=1 Tax=Streptomyces hirsutus TaxID=35620 RepID=A0ABZ1GYJ6_9ACTN|nr:HNH endonuclease signature motif containing protein [Streptomyces hirsutus]WSD11220.1 HNH endonuclease [Streptomyces hirsutus]WTD15426.1 HNH endonuclease [Streptomyces hirsutus]WTD22329.1 HNH endonuclease [Streptomyces hirsutus]
MTAVGGEVRRSEGLEPGDLPAWLRGWKALRRASGENRPVGVLGRFGMGYKLAVQTSVGLGKTIEAGLIAAKMAGDRPPPFNYWLVTDGQHRMLGLGRQWWEETARYTDRHAGAEHAGTSLGPQPFRRIRARTVPRRERYRELRRRVEEREAAGRHQEHALTAGTRRVRDREARDAVLLRSDGLCENPWCLLRALPYRTTAGSYLLEVDHIDDHALGGRDHPSAMIALCPNCHANKTRGADRTALRERLRPVAMELDAAQDGDTARGEGTMPPRSEVVLEQCAALLASLDDADRDRALASLTARFG